MKEPCRKIPLGITSYLFDITKIQNVKNIGIQAFQI